MPGPVNPLEELFARLATTVGNSALGLDPATAARLAALEGCCLRLAIVGPGGTGKLTATLIVRDGALKWRTDHDAHQPNVIVTGPLPALIALLFEGRSPGAGHVTIDGDEAVLQEFGELLRRFAPDLAGPMSDALGPELADSLIGLAEAGIALVRSAGETLQSSIRDGARTVYLADEDFRLLLEKLDQLRLRTDRIDQRVTRLESSPGG